MPAPVINDSVVGGIRKFLEALNSSGGTPIEQLSPKDARPVLVDVQNNVPADLSGIEGSEKTIDHDGKPLKLHIVRPAGAGGDLPVFMFFHGGGWVLGDYPTHVPEAGRRDRGDGVEEAPVMDQAVVAHGHPLDPRIQEAQRREDEALPIPVRDS
jgi:hypothetical protein